MPNSNENATQQTRARQQRGRYLLLRLSVFAVSVAIGLALLVWSGTDWKIWSERLTNLHPLLFLAAMSLLPTVGFPISAFYFFAGAVYDWELGVPLCVAALAVNLTLSYLFTRTFLHAPLAELIERRGIGLPTVRTLRQQFRVTFLLRTIPGPPFALQNYILALAGIPFRIYLPVSLVPQALIGSVAVVTASALSVRFDATELIIGAIAVFVILGAAGSLFVSRRERKSDEARAEA